MRDGIVVAAPCKINLHLRVLGRRIDGFHDLESVFQALSFGDELRFESLKERSVCDLRMEGSVPPENNIVFKAISAFRSHTGFDGGLRVTIEKRTPMGAGLGGGSSDAASSLRALDALAATSLDQKTLQTLAAGLGSDVPFFLEGGTALVSGRGEIVRTIDVRSDYCVVLVNPGFPSETGRAFRLLDDSRSEGQRPQEGGLGEDLLEASLHGRPGDWPFGNDFLPVLGRASAREKDAYGRMLADLGSCGAEFVGLSGSGSTCFGVFSDQTVAQKAVLRLSPAWNFVRFALPLARTGDAVLE
jgi:4-diphosphocytidyl-2-C-methyl-D-erythritol kinase